VDDEANMSKLIFLCDFDGTITQTDTSHAILDHFTGKRWIPINDAWRRFEITTEDRVRRQFGLFHTNEEELGEVVRQVAIDPHFPAFVSWCRRNGHDLKIVSDGFDFCIDRILSQHRLSHLEYVANHLSFEDGTMILDFVHQNPECQMCGNCKWLVSKEAQRNAGRIVYIGDGLSDRGGAILASWIFAKGLLADYCRVNRIPFIPYGSFADILSVFRSGDMEAYPPSQGRIPVSDGKLPCQEGLSPQTG
jgi:2-hydroxy-3-keto-5-methylthiopentenyl-1-phosphate phosphatase